MVRHLVVDGANVVGARPDGWWRDRAGAAARLAGELVAALDAGLLDADHVHLVLEGAARAAVVPDHDRLSVLRAPADGDSAIVALAAELAAPDAAAPDAAAAERRAPALAHPTSHTVRRPRTGSTVCEDARGSAKSGSGGHGDPADRTSSDPADAAVDRPGGEEVTVVTADPTPGARRGGEEVTVVTADRGLRARLTVPTVGPATLLARLS